MGAEPQQLLDSLITLKMDKTTFLHLVPVLLLMVLSKNSIGQPCMNQIVHAVGTEQVGCSEVTVSAEGSFAFGVNWCNTGPYVIGHDADGSYTFSFSPPASGVRVSITALDSHNGVDLEEVYFEVNGAYFPLNASNAGTALCMDPAFITGAGAVRGYPPYIGDMHNITINTAISTLKITDDWLVGSPIGVNVAVYFCCTPPCTTSAGAIAGPSLDICGNGPASISPATQMVLDNNDLLKYVLFSDPSDTLGSILSISNTPMFQFNASTMQKGTTYYIAAVAGDKLYGNLLNLYDPCLDFSNAIEVIWRDRPAVSFSADNNFVCGLECKLINVNFIGTPPFTLTYHSPVTGNITETFPENTGLFYICPDVNLPLSSIVVNAINLVDAYCVCN